jgi:hypothetical protein
VLNHAFQFAGLQLQAIGKQQSWQAPVSTEKQELGFNQALQTLIHWFTALEPWLEIGHHPLNDVLQCGRKDFITALEVPEHGCMGNTDLICNGLGGYTCDTLTGRQLKGGIDYFQFPLFARFAHLLCK